MSESNTTASLLSRPWVLLVVCCIPTVLVTAIVAYNLGAASTLVAVADGVGVHGSVQATSPPAQAVERIVAQPMLPGAQNAASGGIAARVSYAGDVSSLPGSAAVFVFARRPGVPMPVAVEKYQPDQLPVEVVFRAPDDSGMPLQITARLSRLGGVRLEAGDQEASSEPMVPGATEIPIELRIPPL